MNPNPDDLFNRATLAGIIALLVAIVLSCIFPVKDWQSRALATVASVSIGLFVAGLIIPPEK